MDKEERMSVSTWKSRGYSRNGLGLHESIWELFPEMLDTPRRRISSNREAVELEVAVELVVIEKK